MRKILILVLVVAALCITAAAYEVPTDFTDLTLEQAMEELMADYQLTENNFSMSFYNTVTGESYDFNENKFAIAASTYKLPLNMYFYEMEQEGKIDPNATFMWTGMTLSEVHRQSILFSNNEVSEAMTGYWNNYYIYRENMRKYSDMPLEEIDEYYYQTNASCTRMMIDTLKYLYDNSDRFEELIGYMKEAVPGQYFKAEVQEYEIAHKYGEVNEFVNDVAIIYTPQPILLAVYTQGIYGAGVCARIARLVTDYTVWQTEQGGTVPAVKTETPVVEQEEAEQVPTVEEVTEEAPAVEETPNVEEVVEEVPEQAPAEEVPEVAETETPSNELPDVNEIIEEMQQSQEMREKEKRKDNVTWGVIGIVSILLLVAIPIAMRKRI